MDVDCLSSFSELVVAEYPSSRVGEIADDLELDILQAHSVWVLLEVWFPRSVVDIILHLMQDLPPACLGLVPCQKSFGITGVTSRPDSWQRGDVSMPKTAFNCLVFQWFVQIADHLHVPLPFPNQIPGSLGIYYLHPDSVAALHYFSSNPIELWEKFMYIPDSQGRECNLWDTTPLVLLPIYDGLSVCFVAIDLSVQRPTIYNFCHHDYCQSAVEIIHLLQEIWHSHHSHHPLSVELSPRNQQMGPSSGGAWNSKHWEGCGHSTPVIISLPAFPGVPPSVPPSVLPGVPPSVPPGVPPGVPPSVPPSVPQSMDVVATLVQIQTLLSECFHIDLNASARRLEVPKTSSSGFVTPLPKNPLPLSLRPLNPHGSVAEGSFQSKSKALETKSQKSDSTPSLVPVGGEGGMITPSILQAMRQKLDQKEISSKPSEFAAMLERWYRVALLGEKAIQVLGKQVM